MTSRGKKNVRVLVSGETLIIFTQLSRLINKTKRQPRRRTHIQNMMPSLLPFSAGSKLYVAVPLRMGCGPNAAPFFSITLLLGPPFWAPCQFADGWNIYPTDALKPEISAPSQGADRSRLLRQTPGAQKPRGSERFAVTSSVGI